MDETRLEEIIRELDSSVRREGAIVRLIRGSNHPHESAIIANRAGYLRFGIELLKGSRAAVTLAPPNSGGVGMIDVDIDYLISADSDVRFDEFLREGVEAGERRPTPRSWWDWILPFLPGLVALVVGGLVLIGLVTVLRWLF